MVINVHIELVEMGCPKLTYNPHFELIKNGSKNLLTSKNSSKNVRIVYFYGFNGMEKDDEVKGSGNSYDFGARMYDSRVGRWLSRDAHEYKYPGISTYNYSMNNPVIFKDSDGNDGILTIDKENKTVTLETTVYLYGIPKEQGDGLAKELNKSFAALNNSVKVTDINDPNTVWTVTINVNYVYDESMAQNLSTSDDFDAVLPAGTNGLGVGSPAGNTHGQTTQGGNSGWASSIHSALHETFHFLGYDERYLAGATAGVPVVGFESDILSNGQYQRDPTEIMRFHFVDLLDYATSEFSTTGVHDLGTKSCTETIQTNQMVNELGETIQGNFSIITDGFNMFAIDNTKGGEDTGSKVERERVKNAEARVENE